MTLLMPITKEMLPTEPVTVNAIDSSAQVAREDVQLEPAPHEEYAAEQVEPGPQVDHAPEQVDPDPHVLLTPLHSPPSPHVEYAEEQSVEEEDKARACVGHFAKAFVHEEPGPHVDQTPEQVDPEPQLDQAPEHLDPDPHLLLNPLHVPPSPHVEKAFEQSVPVCFPLWPSWAHARVSTRAAVTAAQRFFGAISAK